MHKLITLAFTAFIVSASPTLMAAASEDPHDPSNQPDMDTDIRAEPQLDTGPPNPKSMGRTGRALPGTTDPATNLQSNSNVGNNAGATGTGTTGTTDPATNLQSGNGSTSSDQLDRSNAATRARNNRLDGSSDPNVDLRTNSGASGSTTTNSDGNSGSTSTGTSMDTGSGSTSTGTTGSSGSTSTGAAGGSSGTGAVGR